MKKRVRITKPGPQKPKNIGAILLKWVAYKPDDWRVQATWRDPDRKKKWFTNWPHAEEFARKKDKQLEELKAKGAGRYTIGDAIDSYLKWCEERTHANKIGPDSMRQRHLCIEKHIRPKFGHIRLEALKKRNIEDIALKWAGGENKAAHSTIKYRINWLKAILNYALENEMMRVLPPGLDRLEMSGKPLKRASIPDRSDLEVLREYIMGPRPLHHQRFKWSGLRVLVVLGASCGMRAGEVSGLRWDSIDPVNCEIEIKEAIAPLAGRKGPKTPAGYRKVPLTPRAASILEEHAVVYKQLHGKVVGSVLRTTRRGNHGGDHLSPMMLGEWFNQLMHDCGLVKPGKKPDSTTPKFSFHALRHWCASHWMKSKPDVHQVAKWLGHKRASMTLDVYGHCLDDPDARKKFLEMPDWLDPIIEIDAPSPVRPLEIMEPPALPAPEEPPLELTATAINGNGNAGADDCPIHVPDIAKPWVKPFIMLLANGMPLSEAYRTIAPHVIVRGDQPAKWTDQHVRKEFRRLKMPGPDLVAARLRDERILKLHIEKHPVLDIADKIGTSTTQVYRVLESRHKKKPANTLTEQEYSLRRNAPEPQSEHKKQLKLL